MCKLRRELPLLCFVRTFLYVGMFLQEHFSWFRLLIYCLGNDDGGAIHRVIFDREECLVCVV